MIEASGYAKFCQLTLNTKCCDNAVSSSDILEQRQVFIQASGVKNIANRTVLHVIKSRAAELSCIHPVMTSANPVIDPAGDKLMFI